MKGLIKTIGTAALILFLAVPAFSQLPEWELLDRQAIKLRSVGNYEEAEATAEKAVAAAEKANGPQHPSVAAALSTLVEIYSVKGQYEKTVPYIERIVTIMKKQSGPDSPDIASAMSALADSFRAEGRISQAEPVYKRVLAIREKDLGPNHPEVAATLCSLADMYQDEKRYKEAEPHYRRSLAIRENSLGPNHRDVAITLNNLGMLYYIQGRYAEAEPLLKRSLAIAEQARGPESVDTAEVLNNLAELYRAQGKYAQAVSFCERAVAIEEKRLGPDHPQVAESLKFLAGIYRKNGQTAEAEKREARAAGILAKNTAGARASAPSQPLITNYETPGNLEVRVNPGCISAETLTNQYNPAELYIATSRCIEQERYTDGHLLFTLAGVYIRYDSYRVEDKTAHQAGLALIMSIFGTLDKSKMEAFSKVIGAEDPTQRKSVALCKDIIKIGPPDYYPRYMVQHGMNAYLGKVSGDGLVRHFDAKEAWKKALDSYLHCPTLE